MVKEDILIHCFSSPQRVFTGKNPQDERCGAIKPGVSAAVNPFFYPN
jgi:hypothetical protein